MRIFFLMAGLILSSCGTIPQNNTVNLKYTVVDFQDKQYKCIKVKNNICYFTAKVQGLNVKCAVPIAEWQFSFSEYCDFIF